MIIDTMIPMCSQQRIQYVVSSISSTLICTNVAKVDYLRMVFNNNLQ